MKFIFVSVRRYEADFRKFLIGALRNEGHEVWHVRIGRCNTLSGPERSEDMCGIGGFARLLRRLRGIASDAQVVYVDSTGAVTPVRSMLLRLALRSGIWCFDAFDNLVYNYRGLRRLKAQLAIGLLAHSSRIVFVLSDETRRLLPHAQHLDNAWDIPRIDREGRNWRDLVVLSAIDERFDFRFVEEVARLSPERRIVLHGFVLHDDPAVQERLNSLCARFANVEFRGRYAFEDIPAILDPFAIGFTPYAISEMTEFVNPDKYYMFLQGGLEVISTEIPQARRMAGRIHIARAPHDVVAIVRRLERDKAFRKNLSAAPDCTWKARAHELVGMIQSAEADKGQRNGSRLAVPDSEHAVSRPLSADHSRLEAGR